MIDKSMIPFWDEGPGRSTMPCFQGTQSFPFYLQAPRRLLQSGQQFTYAIIVHKSVAKWILISVLIRSYSIEPEKESFGFHLRCLSSLGNTDASKSKSSSQHNLRSRRVRNPPPAHTPNLQTIPGGPNVQHL
ncbi:hypothetical protein ACTXT7_000459 [Hymenolepis weldensis]